MAIPKATAWTAGEKRRLPKEKKEWQMRFELDNNSLIFLNMILIVSAACFLMFVIWQWASDDNTAHETCISTCITAGKEPKDCQAACYDARQCVTECLDRVKSPVECRKACTSP